MNQNPIERLVRALRRLPGIGEKSATRFALFVLRDSQGLANDLIDALTFVREKVKFCRLCQNLSEEELCSICGNSERDRRLVCVVQEPVDLLAVEKTEEYRGLYHILHGALSPLDGVGPDDIRIMSLVKRIQEGGVSEVILATNPNPEGETTALYLKKILAPLGVRLTRIASGVPVGGTLEYSDPQTLAKSLGNRKDF
jgi:recombination protein RecR